MKNELYENYLKSLKQKYNAVCFDIDGTLTINNSKIIDDRAINMIIDLLAKKVPIVFITGRGETGLNDLKNDVYDRICNSEKITDNDLKRIYVLINDGARLFYSNNTTQREFLNESVYISTKEELNQLLIISSLVKEIKEDSPYGNCFMITYSRDLKNNNIINIRMVFNTNNDKIINSIFDGVNDYIANKGFNGIYLTRGIYENKSVIQIGTATKDKAIERAEKIIGVPKNSMMRIGDCGDTMGNDYSMLNCNQGYSVDKTCESINSCFPVFDNNGNIINGVEATLQLIKNAKILPTVCLEKAEKQNYKRQFAEVERNIVLGRQKLLKRYNDIINSNFTDCNTIDDLFDRFSGSIKIPMYEMELLNDNPLKELWLTLIDENQSYSIRDDENYLLRGSDTYYYFMSNRISKNGVDTTSKNHVINWHKNYLNFLDESLKAILETNNLNNRSNKKLLLGVLDNCRNVLLILLNHYLVSKYCNENILLEISSSDKNEIDDLYKCLMSIEKLMSEICFQSAYNINKDYILKSISDTKNILINNYYDEQKKEEKSNYSKDYRTYREIDNFAENYVAVSLYNKNCDSTEFTNACGLSYGGIELPIIAKIIDQKRIDKLLLLKFNKNVSGYTNKQLLDLRNFNINNFGGLINCNDFKFSDLDLFDDNVLTGKTLQLAINSLYDCDINVNNVCIVRYPSINRINQMFINNSSAIDYNLFFNYIYGLCFNSPYSWKDDDWINENGKIDYTDSLGVFDLNRKKIIECLIKNHNFNINSEVGEYRKRLIK